MQTQHAHFGFQAFGVLALPYFLRKITGVCVVQGFIVIGLRPSYEPLAHLRWHTLCPVKKLEFLDLDRRMYRSTFL